MKSEIRSKFKIRMFKYSKRSFLTEVERIALFSTLIFLSFDIVSSFDI